jgi:hypothetical protein
MSAGALSVNVACLACDGTRPCAQCRAVTRVLAAAGHRVHRSSRYAALRAAADGTYGFSACVMPVASGESRVAEAIVALLSGARVAIATDDPAALPEGLPEGFVSFPRVDFAAGRLPRAWLDALSGPDADLVPEPVNVVPERSSGGNVVPERSSGGSVRSAATRRLRSIAIAHRSGEPNARALLDDELAWYRASGIGFALVSMRIARAAQPPKGIVTESLRAGDSVAAADGGLVIVLPATDAHQAEQVCARVIKRVLKHRRELKARDVKTGIAVCPQDGVETAALIARAKERT